LYFLYHSASVALPMVLYKYVYDYMIMIMKWFNISSYFLQHMAAPSF